MTEAKIKNWPTPQDYNEAIQNLTTNIADEELQQGRVETDTLGLPRPRTGSFASVYRIHCQERDWAVRCFLRDVPDAHQRYKLISNFVQNDSLPYTVGFDFQAKGIRVGGRWLPILKMEWVEGDTLDNYIKANFHRIGVEFAESFRQMCADIQAAGIAHGDLQHGNIIIKNGRFFLVDYDGMFVPGLEGWLSNELGHRNYQHPGRAANTFGAHLDNFSSWVIYSSLIALAKDAQLCQQLPVGDNCLLFRQHDFENSRHSPAFNLFERSQEDQLRRLGRLIRSFLLQAPHTVPPLTMWEEYMESEMPELPQAPDLPKLFAEAAPNGQLPSWMDGTQLAASVASVSAKNTASFNQLSTMVRAGILPISEHTIEPGLQKRPPRKVSFFGGGLWLGGSRSYRDERLVAAGTPVIAKVTKKWEELVSDIVQYRMSYEVPLPESIPTTLTEYVSSSLYRRFSVGDKVTVLFDPATSYCKMYLSTSYRANPDIPIEYASLSEYCDRSMIEPELVQLLPRQIREPAADATSRATWQTIYIVALAALATSTIGMMFNFPFWSAVFALSLCVFSISIYRYFQRVKHYNLLTKGMATRAIISGKHTSPDGMTSVSYGFFNDGTRQFDTGSLSVNQDQGGDLRVGDGITVLFDVNSSRSKVPASLIYQFSTSKAYLPSRWTKHLPSNHWH